MNKLIPLLAFSILLLVPVGAQNAFAGAVIPPLPPQFANNYVHAHWIGDDLSRFRTPPTIFNSDPNSPFLLSGATNDGICSPIVVGSIDHRACGFILENFVDGLPYKDIEVHVFYPPGTDPGYFPGTAGAIAPGSECNLISADATPRPEGLSIFRFQCMPNPTQESIGLKFFEVPFQNIQEIAIWTTSYDPTTVTTVIGGELIPLDTTMVLVAGTQSFSWMIPVILSGIGIGLFVFRKTENS